MTIQRLDSTIYARTVRPLMFILGGSVFYDLEEWITSVPYGEPDIIGSDLAYQDIPVRVIDALEGFITFYEDYVDLTELFTIHPPKFQVLKAQGPIIRLTGDEHTIWFHCTEDDAVMCEIKDGEIVSSLYEADSPESPVIYLALFLLMEDHSVRFGFDQGVPKDKYFKIELFPNEIVSIFK